MKCNRDISIPLDLASFIIYYIPGIVRPNKDMTPFMNPGELLGFIREHSALELVRDYIFTGLPYVFRYNPTAQQVLKQHLSSGLEVNQDRILVVGSARTGFSLDPNNFPRKFYSRSDVDVIIIDEGLFDSIWKSLLKWHYPRKFTPLRDAELRWIRHRKDDVFWGWVYPDKFAYDGFSLPYELQSIRDISERWFGAFRSLAQYVRYPDLARREVTGRLYRTMEHACLYHENGLLRLCAKLTAGRA